MLNRYKLFSLLQLVLILLFAFVLKPIWGQELAPLPKLSSRVIDQAGLLTSVQRQELEALLRNFERKKGAQVVLLTLKTVQPESIEAYSIRLAESWKIGRKKVDDGAILLIAKEERRLRIEVGYGLEGVLSDIIAHNIIEKIIKPFFKRGDFYTGIKGGLLAMLQVIEGEDLPEPILRKSGSTKRGGLFLFAIALIFISFLLRSLLGGGLGLVLSVLIGAVLGYFFLSWLSGLLLSLFISMLSLNSRSYLGGMGYYYGGFGGGFGSSGGGSFGGGFSGGGGGFGGGGASGSW